MGGISDTERPRHVQYEMPETTADELSERLQTDSDPPLVVDIRNEDEFEDWHIPGSENVPVYDDLKDDLDAAKAALSDLPDDEEIVTVCAAGVMSETATEILREMGYEAKTLVDGMNGWSRVHRSAPVETDIGGTLVQVTRPGRVASRTCSCRAVKLQCSIPRSTPTSTTLSSTSTTPNS